MKNLMEEYIHFTAKKTNRYVKWIMGKKFNQEITDEFFKTYINARYYNIINTEKRARAFYQRILNELTFKENILNKKLDLYELEDTSTIEYTKKIFSYMLFFDNVRNVDNFKNIESLKEIVNRMAEIKAKIENSQVDKEFVKKLYDEIKNDMIDKEVFLENIDDDEFYIEITNNKENNNIYFSKIQHKIKMPMQYSDEIIEKVFNTGIIGEDKIEIEFILLSAIAIKDILNGNFEDIYISEFVTTILKKEQKLQSILGRINNQALQEKIMLNIMYEDLILYKKQITKLMKEGYSFTITLDGALKSVDELIDLKMFKYVFVPKDIKMYKEIMLNKKLYTNLITK